MILHIRGDLPLRQTPIGWVADLSCVTGLPARAAMFVPSFFARVM
jgi:hypothetical protein